MQDILIYSDSLTWGIIPNTRRRLSFTQRWPGVFEAELKAAGYPVKILENCLNGRRTVWSDPYKDGRDGSQGFAQVLEMHAPLKLVVIMLGTNDFQTTHNNDAWMSAQGMLKLINIIRTAPIEPGMPVPDILIISPPMMQQPKGPLVQKFKGGVHRSVGLAGELQLISDTQQCYFFDAASVTDASAVDGIHLDAPQHVVLGQAVAKALIDFSILQNQTRI